MDVLVLPKEDHKTVEKLFKHFKKADDETLMERSGGSPTR